MSPVGMGDGPGGPRDRERDHQNRISFYLLVTIAALLVAIAFVMSILGRSLF